MKFSGPVHKFGDDINTDQIIPARYLNTSDARELAAHVMEDADATFASRVKPGDIVVAGRNFGCGSSREHAPLCIKEAGVACVIAKSSGWGGGPQMSGSPVSGCCGRLTSLNRQRAAALPLQARIFPFGPHTSE